MKKSLFAVAAATAFTGAAQAQSSVTVYGILDAGWAGGNQYVQQRTSSSATQSIQRATFSQFQASGGQSTNRLGFRGNEDMGGGLTAKFVFETNINANVTTWAPEIRQAWLGLAKKGLGEARIGTQNTLIWQIAAPMTVGQLNNFTGSVINSSSVGAPLSDAAGTATAGAFTNRAQRTLQVDSERMAGFQAKASYTLNNTNSTQTNNGTTSSSLGYSGGTNNFSGWGVSLDFTGVPKLRVAGAWQQFTGENPYNASQTAVDAGGVPANVSGNSYTTGQPSSCASAAFTFQPLATNGALAASAASNCVNVKDDQGIAAASYDFGILSAYVNYVTRKVTSQQNGNAYLKRTAQEIGVRANITPTISGFASIGNGRFSGYGVNNPTANFTGYQLGTSYMLSKRTNLYAIYGQVGTSSVTPTTSYTSTAQNTNNYGIGARHTF
jgi:predicted porin